MDWDRVKEYLVGLVLLFGLFFALAVLRGLLGVS